MCACAKAARQRCAAKGCAAACMGAWRVCVQACARNNAGVKCVVCVFVRARAQCGKGVCGGYGTVWGGVCVTAVCMWVVRSVCVTTSNYPRV